MLCCKMGQMINFQQIQGNNNSLILAFFLEGVQGVGVEVGVAAGVMLLSSKFRC